MGKSPLQKYYVDGYRDGWINNLEYVLNLMEDVESLTDLYIRLAKKREAMLDG